MKLEANNVELKAQDESLKVLRTKCQGLDSKNEVKFFLHERSLKIIIVKIIKVVKTHFEMLILQLLL